VSIAAGHENFVSIGARDARTVIVAVGGVNPSVEAATKRSLVAVRVASEIKRAEEFFLFVSDAIAIGVLEEPDVRDAPGDAFPGKRPFARRLLARGRR